MQKRFTIILMTAVFVLSAFSVFGWSIGVRGDVPSASLPYALKTNAEAVNIFAAADTAAATLGQVDKDVLLYPVEITGNWYKIKRSDGNFGYVSGQYVDKTTGTGSISAAGADLRAGAGETYASLGTWESGTAVTLIGREGNWLEVTLSDGAHGYMLNTEITTPEEEYPIFSAASADAVASLDDYTEKAAVIGSDTTNIRSGPGTSYSIVTTLSPGTAITIIGESGDWYQIRMANGATGYVANWLVEITATEGSLAGLTIVVDPGHGSYKSSTSTTLDSGAVGPNGLKEKDVNLAIALALRDYLAAQGATVIMTRESDVGVLTLTDRANVANNANADYFISIHCNSYNAGSTGVETWYSKFGDTTLNDERKAMATAIQAQLYTSLNITNRGIKCNETETSDFTVIKKTTMPAVLVESAFISNPVEEALLKTPAFQNKVAQSICQGMVNHVANYYQGFSDVRTHWARESIEYAVEAGLFNGVSANTFCPSQNMSRGMLVTVLYRMAGEPAVSASSSFTDVDAAAYYADAVAWASENGVVEGMGNGIFAPNNSITRQDLVTMFSRYAQVAGLTLPETITDSISKYSDYADIGAWALEAVEWAYKGGLINGRTDTTLVPTGTATRAEVAVICQRFLENVVK